MLKKVMAALLGGSGAKTAATPNIFYKPYANEHVNCLYNLLFCDDLTLHRDQVKGAGAGPWQTLLAEQADIPALRKIADDESNEGRVRALAYNRLRAAAQTVPSKKLLGVIIEVPLEMGLDVLAAFPEGGARYLNQAGEALIFEGAGHPVEHLAKELVAVSQPVVDRIGPWDKQRLPPPPAGNARISFLVSDGLYFGEAPLTTLQRDGMAGPVLGKATELLQLAVKVGLEHRRKT